MNLSERDLAPNEKGQIKATLYTKSRRGKLQKSVTVSSNDPNNPTIKLLLIANVKEELSVDPTTVYFKNMTPSEQRYKKVHIKNISKQKLEILPIQEQDKMISVEFVNHSPDQPVELNPNDTLDLLVGFKYIFNSPRFAKQIHVKYTGGEATDASFRIFSTLEQTEIEKQIQETQRDPNIIRKSPLKTFLFNNAESKIPPATETQKQEDTEQAQEEPEEQAQHELEQEQAQEEPEHEREQEQDEHEQKEEIKQ